VIENILYSLNSFHNTFKVELEENFTKQFDSLKNDLAKVKAQVERLGVAESGG
jgi:hypothetical protein